MTAVALVATLERQRARCLDTEHRLARERKTLDTAIRQLCTGVPAEVVLADLRARHLRVETERAPERDESSDALMQHTREVRPS